jgi:hypothetical protein
MRYACLCCGHRTLEQRPGFTFELCEICCFEDPYEDSGLLARSQLAYAQHGAVDPDLVPLTRSPTEAEAPPAWFLTLAEAPSLLIEMVEQAFGDIELDGGVSISEADLFDAYDSYREQGGAPNAEHNQPGPWHAMTPEELGKLEPMYGGFHFMDVNGLRFYTPAYIRALLQHESPNEMAYAFGPGGNLMFMLESGRRHDAFVVALTPAQRTVIARYLAYLASDPQFFTADDARKTLRTRWGLFLDPKHLQNIVDSLREEGAPSTQVPTPSSH